MMRESSWLCWCSWGLSCIHDQTRLEEYANTLLSYHVCESVVLLWLYAFELFGGEDQSS